MVMFYLLVVLEGGDVGIEAHVIHPDSIAYPVSIAGRRPIGSTQHC
jgi:hypothetical protein